MPTRTFTPMAGSGYLTSIKPTYPAVIAGPGNDVDTTSHYLVGQDYQSGNPNMGAFIGLLAFDTSTIPAGAIITSARFRTAIASGGNSSTQDFVLVAAPYAAGYGPWRPAITPADWLSNLNVMTNGGWAAILGTADITPPMPGSGTMLYWQYELVSAITKGGITELVVFSDRHRAGTAPAVGVPEYVHLARTPPPELVVTWTPTGPATLGVEWRAIVPPNVVGQWNVLDCDVVGASWTRGASSYRGVYTVPEAAQASLELLDPGRQFDPLNQWSEFYGFWDVGAELRLSYGGTIVFGGRITDIETSLNPGAIARAKVTARDPLGKMAGVDINESFTQQEPTDQRFQRLLDRAQVAVGPGLRLIEAGGVGMQPAAAQGDAWSLAVDLSQHELGFVEWLADGRVRWSKRSTVWDVTPQPTLKLGCLDASYIPVSSATTSMQRDFIRNLYRATRTGSVVTMELHAPDSQWAYGLREERRDDFEHAGDDIMVDWEYKMMERHAFPVDEWKVVIRTRKAADVEAIESLPLMIGRAHLFIEHGEGGADPDWHRVDTLLRLAGVDWSVDETHLGTCTLTLGQTRAGQARARPGEEVVPGEEEVVLVLGPLPPAPLDELAAPKED